METPNLQIEITSDNEVIIIEKDTPDVFAEIFGDTMQDRKNNAKTIIDSFQKSRKYDALKHRNDELHRLLRIVNDVVLIHSARLKKEIKQALKNNEND